MAPVTPKKKRKKPAASLSARFGPASLEARHGIEFPAGATRARKREYVRAIKKAQTKRIEIGSPAFWAHMEKYGFTQIKKKKRRDGNA